jgi:hypothetical protein
MKDTFVKLFELTNSPFKLFALVVMGIMAGVGWFAYTEKDAFMASYRAQQALPRMNGKFEEATGFIFKRSEADLVAIFDINTLLNTRRVAWIQTREEGRVRAHDGYDVGLFSNNLANNRDVVSLMSGEAPCSEYRAPQSYIGFFYIDKGITYMCRISVPPEHAFIGQITVGWREKPADDEIARTVLRIASNILYSPPR